MKLNEWTVGALAVAAMVPAVFAQEPVKTAKKVEGPVVCTMNGKTIASAEKAGANIEYKGKNYYFCCGNCKAAFEKADDAGKAKLAKVSDLRTEKVQLEKRLETINAELKTLTEPAKTTSAATPAVVYCVVTDEKIGATSEAQSSVVYNGKTYYFCCAGCRPKFEAEPAKYAKMADEAEAKRAKN
jgi:Cu+-exporting ATPase